MHLNKLRLNGDKNEVLQNWRNSNFLQSTLSAVGITGTYSGHSFRIGAATIKALNIYALVKSVIC